jgi:hypothetical protein
MASARESERTRSGQFINLIILEHGTPPNGQVQPPAGLGGQPAQPDEIRPIYWINCPPHWIKEPGFAMPAASAELCVDPLTVRAPVRPVQPTVELERIDTSDIRQASASMVTMHEEGSAQHVGSRSP